MFPPNAPHVEIKQGLMAILPDFRGLENENPYVHVRAFEEVIGSFYAQNMIETAKLRFFLFSLKDKAKGEFLQKEPEDTMDYLDEIGEEFQHMEWTKSLRFHKTRTEVRATTSSGSIFKLREEDNLECQDQFVDKGDRGTQAGGE
uniref:Retrotransposon gag domain-containing protein n=1 Tax=Fagus sylvatica TaxID=28930 RepID=A0A2N9H398_FAGSY